LGGSDEAPDAAISGLLPSNDLFNVLSMADMDQLTAFFSRGHPGKCTRTTTIKICQKVPEGCRRHVLSSCVLGSLRYVFL
jgi:hypothetical protein